MVLGKESSGKRKHFPILILLLQSLHSSSDGENLWGQSIDQVVRVVDDRVGV
ncbi:hypothetical protein [Microcoleus sp. K4-C2]|uniref:hypothetical protein n=1 Tax=Microcoleus sp. K4-C2 TaxID=2818792 RepID=UPI00404087EC